MKKLNRNIKDKTNLMLFLLMCVFTLTLTVGYSAINSELTVSGEASFRIMEGTRITNVSLYETTNNGIESYKNKFSSDSITLGVDLKELESTITYKVEVTNFGTVASVINSIETTSNSNQSSEVELIGYNKSSFIYPGDVKEIYIKVKYKNNISTLPETTSVNLIIDFEYVVPESTLAQGSDGSATTTFYNSGPIQKGEVEGIEFLPNLTIGEDAIGYWDASYKKDNSVIAWYTDEDENNLYELYIGGNGKVYAYSDTRYQFTGFTKMESIEFNDIFDTSNAINMTAMFINCSSLTSLDLSNFNTSNVTSMSRMFYSCSNISSLDISNFNTVNVTSMYYMFNDCKLLTSLDLKSFILKSGVDLSYMFRNCSRITNLDIRKWEFANPNTTYTFSYLPANCNIIVKNDIEKNNLLAIRSSFTNIKTVAELEEL